MRTCPKCGHQNSDIRTFCANCGTEMDEEPNLQDVQTTSADPTGICIECGLPAEQDYQLQLCAHCRTKAAHRPLPKWINTSCALLGIIFVFALIKFPAALRTDIAFERGHRLEKAGNYAGAAAQYAQVIQQYPKFNNALARYAISTYRAGQTSRAIMALDKLRGRELPTDTIDELNGITKDLQRRQQR